MGKYVDNTGGPSLHTGPDGVVIGVRPLTRHREEGEGATGAAWVPIGPELTLADYQALHAAAVAGPAAFESAIAASLWGAGYLAWPTGTRPVVRRHILARPPLAVLPG
jgi:hypothetical protein